MIGINHLRNKLATAKKRQAADTYGLSLSPMKLISYLYLTYDRRASYHTLESLFVPIVDVVWKLMSQVGACANEQKDQGQEGLKVEKSRLYSKLVTLLHEIKLYHFYN